MSPLYFLRAERFTFSGAAVTEFASLQNFSQKMQAAAAFAREWAATPALKAAEDDGHCQEQAAQSVQMKVTNGWQQTPL